MRTSTRPAKVGKLSIALPAVFSMIGCLLSEMKMVSLRFLRGALLLSILFSNLTVHAVDQFVYTNNDIQGTNKVLGFRVGADGSLSEIAGSPFPTAGSGDDGLSFFASNRIVVSASGKFLYASNSGSNDVSAFSIDPSSGNLTPVPGSPFPLDSSGPSSGGISLAVTPDGRFLMAGNPLAERITSFSIGADGALTAMRGSPFFAGGQPAGMKASPNGKFLAVALLGGVAMFGIAPDGSLAAVPGSPFGQGGVGAAAGVDMNCRGNVLFAGEANASRITIVDVFSIAPDGVLVPITGSPFVAEAGANSNVPLLSPDERLLFVSNQEAITLPSSTSTVTAFNVAADGTLTLIPGSPFPAGGFPSGMATNPAGTLLFTANDQAVGVLSIGINGTLTPVPGSPFSAAQPFSSVKSLAAFPSKTCDIPVDIDIKPGGARNSINLRSKGVVTVAVLSSASFNPLDVIVDTVRIAGASPVKFTHKDINSDGVADLVLHFRTQDLQLKSNSTELTLTAKLRDGRSITGTDSVRILARNRKDRPKELE